MIIDFEALFAKSPNPYVVLDPELRIVWMNEAYLKTTMRKRPEITGKLMFEAFPSAPDSEGRRQLKHSFARVIETGKCDEIALIRYDIRSADGSMDVRYWSATHTPLVTQGGRVSLILQHTVDVTELQSLRTLRDEMGLVQRAQAVQSRNRDLVEESEELRLLVEEAPGFVAVLGGPDHTFKMTNAAYRQLVGQRDLAGKSLAEALPEVVEQGFLKLLDEVRKTARRHVARRQKVLLRNEPAGQLEELFLDFIYQPIVIDGGEVSGVFVQGHDITDQVEAEQRQEILINELNHRVKNTLAIVQGLAAQSFRKGISAEDGLAAFSERLTALSAAHNLLTRGNWEVTDLADIVRAGVGAAAGVDDTRIAIVGPQVALSPQTATTVAMVVHELATNAVKFGALQAPEGVIKVSWSVKESEGERLLIFQWIECAGPEVLPPTRQGFGTRLVKRGFGSDSRSSVNLDYCPTGLQCRIVTRLAGHEA